jgi:RNA polymerase sigma factor (sigma-70 family)
MADNTIQNFGLKLTTFSDMLNALQQGDESLFEHVFVKHFSDCRNYLMRECDASADDAYDITVETIINFRKRLIEGKIEYGNLRYYFTKMAKDNFLKLLEKNKRLPVGELVLNEADREDEVSNEFNTEQIQYLEKAWTKLNPDCQKLLRSHIYDGLQLKQVALLLNENEANIRKRKERCMDKLKSSFFDIYVD